MSWTKKLNNTRKRWKPSSDYFSVFHLLQVRGLSTQCLLHVLFCSFHCHCCGGCCSQLVFLSIILAKPNFCTHYFLPTRECRCQWLLCLCYRKISIEPIIPFQTSKRSTQHGQAVLPRGFHPDVGTFMNVIQFATSTRKLAKWPTHNAFESCWRVDLKTRTEKSGKRKSNVVTMATYW